VSADAESATACSPSRLRSTSSVRADPLQFAVTRDHVMADVERVVAETDRYAVVAKREGTPAAVAIEEDPRG
jgi:hypothetical protein